MKMFTDWPSIGTEINSLGLNRYIFLKLYLKF